MENKEVKNKEIITALKWAFENLLGNEYFCPAIDEYVLFTAGGIKHTIKAKTYPLKIKMIYDVVELLETAEIIWEGADKLKRNFIKKVYHLRAIKEYNGKKQTIYIVLRKEKDGNIYWDHNTLKEKDL